MRTLQESNKKMRDENLRLKAEVTDTKNKYAALELKSKKDKDQWQKELLTSLSHSSQREQQLKSANDAQQKEILDLKDARNRAESSISKLRNDLKSEQLQLANAKKKIEQLSREIQTTFRF